MNHTLEEAKLFLPATTGVSIQLNRGQGWTGKYKNRSTPGKLSHTCHWSGKKGLSQSQALGEVLVWIWELHVAEGGQPPDFDVWSMRSERE